MIDFGAQKDLFKLIGSELRKKTEAVLIGGSAMMFYGAKTATFDVDLVFTEKAALNRIKAALQKIGFSENKEIEIFGHYKSAKIQPQILKSKGARFDLFYKEIICYTITDSIISRIKEVHEFGNLAIKIIAPEDILLLKCATEREKDLVDGAEIARSFEINWDIVISESIRQMELGKAAFPIFLFEFLHNLRDKFKIEVPENILEKLQKLSEDILSKLEKKNGTRQA